MFQKVVNSAKLISLPDIYFHLKELLDDPDYTMAEIALLVGRDPGMAARFLRVVNSPLNRRACKIETVSHAVSILGVRQIHDIVLSASIAKAFEGMETDVVDMKKFWQRSFYCALMSKQLALECEIKNSDRMFVIGLLHDIGHLFMYRAVPEESQQAILSSQKMDRPLFRIERELLGFDSAVIGGYVMRQWQLPKIFWETTSFHPEPGKALQFAVETSLLHVSSRLVMSDLEAGLFGQGTFAVDSEAWSITNLSADQCLEINREAAHEFCEVSECIFL